MAARLSDQVTYAYCTACGGLLIGSRQAQFRSTAIWHTWCAVTETWASRQGQGDRRN